MAGEGNNGGADIEIRLPATPEELCRGQTVVAGTVLGPDGEPVEGIRIGLVEADPRGFSPRKWGETGPDGTFEIRLLAGWPGPDILAIHYFTAEVRLPCSQLGLYGPGGFTMPSDEATLVEAGEADATDNEIRIPASPDELLPVRVGAYFCGGQQPAEEIVTIQGKVVGPNDQPLEGILLWAWAGSADNGGNATTGEGDSFAIAVPDGSFTLDVHIIGRECTHVGWYGPGGFTDVWYDATRIEVDGESVLDIVIRAPGPTGRVALR